MNIEKNLILIKDEDRTEEVTHCSSITNGSEEEKKLNLGYVFKMDIMLGYFLISSELMCVYYLRNWK